MCPGYQTDFSVTNRLLPPVGYGSGSGSVSSSQSDSNAPQTWHGILPPDQGSVSTKFPSQPWTGAPNAYFPYSSESSLPYAQSRCYTSGAAGQFGTSYDTYPQGKSHKCAGDVPLHHESNYYPDSFLHPRAELSGHIEPAGSVKDEPISPAPKSRGSNSTTSKCTVCRSFRFQLIIGQETVPLAST